MIEVFATTMNSLHKDCWCATGGLTTGLTTGSAGNEVGLIKTLNVEKCIISLEEHFKMIADQQALIMAQQQASMHELKIHRYQLEKFQLEVREELQKNKSRQKMIKNRQEMIFTKQDQIQYTLHGETLYFQTPPTMSSPPPSFTSPTASSAGLRFDTTNILQQSSAVSSSAVDSSAVDLSALTSELDPSDFDSLFSFDWLAETQQQNAAVAGSAPQESIDHGVQGFADSVMSGTLPRILLQPQVSTLPQHVLAGTPQQQVLAGTPQQQTLAGTPQQQVLAGTSSLQSTSSCYIKKTAYGPWGRINSEKDFIYSD